MIFVGGPSGTGKTTAISRFVGHHPQFHHIKASDVLRQQNRPVENLSPRELEENQVILEKYLRSVALAGIIVDGHAVIPTSAGLYHVSSAFFRSVQFRAMIFLWEDPEVVASRKGHPVSGSLIREITSVQSSEASHMQRISRELGIKNFSIRSSAWTEIEDTLLQICGGRPGS
ncbi:AAA family ATPase [Rhizobium leguminosarum]|uniref:ATP-binding protein n=1 Tax=Rhizobium leguminosarum TaxID=384 RepID=UPI001C96BED5|nr:AAA family ATPase [Rhizobium leguminosarum]